MSHLDYDELCINGCRLKGYQIAEYCANNDLENIRKLGQFIQEWLEPNPTIKVQTSGSTGISKIIAVEKQQMLQSAAATAKYFEFQVGDSALLCLPINYIAGKMMVVRSLLSKLNLICIEPNNSPLNSIPKGTVIDFAPLTPMQLKSSPGKDSVKTILLGGGPISPDLEENCQRFSAAVFHGYGMTETLSHIALRRINGAEKSGVYQALPGVRFQLDERNCLVIYVPFLKEPVLTNDVAELMTNESFVWKGRADNIINSGGIKLFPEEIEKKLALSIPERFFVAGVPDNLLGEKLCLFIEGANYPTERFTLLKTRIEAHLGKFEKPKAIFFIEKFAVTESGKMKRKESMGLIPEFN